MLLNATVLAAMPQYWNHSAKRQTQDAKRKKKPKEEEENDKYQSSDA